MVCYAENLIAQLRPNYNNLPIMDREVAKAIILTEIPLAELIAVARAAKMHHSQFPSIKSSNCEMCSALDALSATGKAEL